MDLANLDLTSRDMYLLNSRAKVQFCEGSFASGKSYMQGIAFYFRVFSAPRDAKLFVLAGQSQNWVERYLADASSIVNLFDLKYSAAGNGGARITVETPTGLKYIYVVGYSNVKTWKSVLGLNLRGFLIEEINTADMDFVRQCFGRIARFEDAFMYCNSNGSYPDNPVYTEYLDRCRPITAHSPMIPEGTLEAMMTHPNPNADWEYLFLHFSEAAFHSAKVKSNMWEVHPEGSYDYKIYTLGERGLATGAVFAKLLTPDIVDIPKKKLNFQALRSVDVGVDVGNEAKTIFTIVGYTQNRRTGVVLESHECDGLTHDDIVKDLNAFIGKWHTIFKDRIKYCWVDDGLQHLVRKIGRELKFPKIKTHYCKKPPIVERVQLLQQLMLQKRWIFLEESTETVKMLRKIITDGKGGVLDNNDPWNDYLDSMWYCMTPYMNNIARVKVFDADNEARQVHYKGKKYDKYTGGKV